MYRFGAYVLDTRRRSLQHLGEAVHLEPQAFDLLVHLVEHRDEVVSKRALLDGVWGHPFVSEAAITTRIKEIRRALGDDGTRQHTIRNVRGRGYRFVGDITAIDDDGDGRATDGLIGRSVDLAAVISGIGDSTVVTIAGPGGVGKSTLARAAASNLSSAFPDGVHLVELAPLDEPEQLLAAIARALRIVLEADTPESTIATIGRLRMLLVLDNCEHIVDEVARLVDQAIRTPAAAVRVLTTSRVRLGVSGEHVIGLAPLDGDDAVRLFELRARLIVPDWSASRFGHERVRATLDHLDRLPLTIEMAAARLGSMTFEELEGAVGRGGGWPTQMAHRTPSPRHRSLLSVVQWSADLLTDEHRRIFEDCSVFAAAISIADAAPVLTAGVPDDLRAAFVELVDSSLLAVDLDGPTARYRMLATVKAVAHSWLEASGRSSAVRRRHAIAIADIVASIDRGLRTPHEPTSLQHFDEIVAEVRAAHRWAGEQEPEVAERLARGLHLVAYSRLWSEPATWSTALLERGDTAQSDMPRSRLLIAGAEANAGLLTSSRQILDEVLRTSDDPTTSATALEILSDVCLYAGDLDQCIQHVDALAAIGADLGDPHILSIAATNASLAMTFGGDTDAARSRLDAVDHHELPPSGRAWIAYARGEACSAAGDHQGAITAFTDAIRLGVAVQNPFVVSVAQSSMATEHARVGSNRLALETFAACLDGYHRHGNLVHAVSTLRNLVSLLAELGASPAAAVVGGATSAPDVRPTYGAEAERLSAVLQAVARSTGDETFEELARIGRSVGIDGAVARARSAVTTLLEH